MKWYVVQTHPNKENLALFHLNRQGFQVWLPRVERVVKHARQVKRVHRPLFPGYLFVNLDPENAAWRVINGTIGVLQIISFGKKPSAVEEAFMWDLKKAENSDGLIELQDFELEVSSAGLDAPFAVSEQYKKNLGKEVKVYTHDGRKHEGELCYFDEEKIIITYQKKIKIEGRKKKEWVTQREEYFFESSEKEKKIRDTKVIISFK